MSRMLLARVGRKTFTAYRKEPGGRNPDTGRWEEGKENPIEVSGNEQPMTGYDKQMLPESFRSKDVRDFFSNQFLYSVEEADGREPDEIEIEGYRFEVQKRMSYQMGIRRHYEYRIVRVEQSAGG